MASLATSVDPSPEIVGKSMTSSSYRMIGLMSGTSLDGIDVCCVDFTGVLASDSWTYRLTAAETVPYSTEWTGRLLQAPTMSGEQLIQLHVDYGHLIGHIVRQFIDRHSLENVSGVASHGHTVFHQPENRLTFQLGDGETIAAYVR
jgi:anhydro-N-acetylmuramic acid kinase